LAGQLCGRWHTEVPVDPRHAWIHSLNARTTESPSTVSKATRPLAPPFANQRR
jgi:hypothetical protein